jgi:hypothetical protein
MTAMFRKTIIGAAAALTTAAASLATTTVTASAGYNPGVFAGYGRTAVTSVPRQHCEPVYKTILWPSRDGEWAWTTVRTGESCTTVYVKQYDRVGVPLAGRIPGWMPSYGWAPLFGWQPY